ncbi:MAG: hypothetical protein RL151_1694, partial [Bacteroidota bacterium]
MLLHSFKDELSQRIQSVHGREFNIPHPVEPKMEMTGGFPVFPGQSDPHSTDRFIRRSPSWAHDPGSCDGIVAARNKPGTPCHLQHGLATDGTMSFERIRMY